jgi:PAS domain S-box-containing protein
LCLAGAALGALGLVDAAAGTAFLPVLAPTDASMQANTGFGLLLLGGAAALRGRGRGGAARRGVSLVAALIVLALAIVTLVEYALDVDLGVDQMIVASAARGAHPGRPAPATAIALACLGGGLVLLGARPAGRARPSEWLVLAGGFIGLTALLGFIFSVELHREVVRAPLVGTALPTSVALLLLSVGALLLEQPAAGLMRVATSPGPGGRQFRRLVFPAILVPILIGVVVTFPIRSIGGDALSVVVAVLAAAMTLTWLFVLASTGMSLNRSYDELEQSRAATRSLFEQAPEAVFIADMSGRYTDVNSAACRMLGYTREEILGMHVRDLIVPDEHERLEQTRRHQLEGGIEVGEWWLRRKDGSSVPTEIRARIFPDGRWQGLVRDISTRKRLEGELRVAEAEQKFLADLGSALVSTIDDRETVEIVAHRVVADLADCCSIETLDEDGRLYDWAVVHRDAVKAAICRELEEVQFDPSRPYVGSTVRETRQPLLIRDVTPAYIDAMAQNEDQRRLTHELGVRSMIALPLAAHGGVVGSLVLMSTTPGRTFSEKDIPFAEAVAMRAALAVEKARLYRIAQHAIHMREDVLSVVAHDLRNPLGTILMQTALLRRRTDNDDRSRKPGEVIERAATRMNRLIQDLLDVARMEGGQLAIDRERLSTRQVIADAVQAQQSLAAAAAMELRVDAAKDLPDLWADCNRVLQIFENLVGNAIKFTEPGGRITVGAVPGEGHVLFWVADTGTGIAPEHVPHLFERLWQASKAGQHGAGLGLPIVKGIVEAHGGHIWVETRVGAGSTFFFTIPEAPPGETWREQPAPGL